MPHTVHSKGQILMELICFPTQSFFFFPPSLPERGKYVLKGCLLSDLEEMLGAVAEISWAGEDRGLHS